MTADSDGVVALPDEYRSTTRRLVRVANSSAMYAVALAAQATVTETLSAHAPTPLTTDAPPVAVPGAPCVEEGRPNRAARREMLHGAPGRRDRSRGR